MLKTKKLFLVLALAALSLCSMYTIGCAAVTEQQAMVGGEVAADGLVQVGAQVQQGDVLVLNRWLVAALRPQEQRLAARLPRSW